MDRDARRAGAAAGSNRLGGPGLEGERRVVDPLVLPERLRPGAAAATLADFMAHLGVPASRPAEEIGLRSFFGYRSEHDSSESPAEAAEVDRQAALEALLGQKLIDVKVYRIGDPQASWSGNWILGAIDVYVVGRDRWGNLVGVKTTSVET